MFNSMLHTTCSLVCLYVYCIVTYKPKGLGLNLCFYNYTHVCNISCHTNKDITYLLTYLHNYLP